MYGCEAYYSQHFFGVSKNKRKGRAYAVAAVGGSKGQVKTNAAR